MTRLDPRDQSPEAFLDQAVRAGFPEAASRRLLVAVVGRGEHDPDRWMTRRQVPRRLAEAVGPLPRLRLDRVLTSPIDGFRKVLFRTADDRAIETVVIPLHRPDAASVCLSSQVGCSMGCVFCATARMVDRRNLETWEIVDQFLQAREVAAGLGRKVTGAVFMGMGEPFLNYDRVIASANLLRSPSGACVGAGAITISTVGIVPAIDRYTDEGQRFRLAISLGAATDELRARLVPVASRWPIRAVIDAARRYAVARRDRVMLAYVCIGGINTNEGDARALGELIGDLPVRLNLIDVNDPTGQFRPPGADELRTFRDALTRYVGQPVVRRYSGGGDIQAACGTLAGIG